MNVLVPLDALPGLSVPPAAITDGSADPVWVELPVRGEYLYGRKRMLPLPFDAATAETARRWLRLDRRRRAVLAPISISLLVAAAATVFMDDSRFDAVRLGLFAAGFLLQLWTAHAVEKVTVAQQPDLIGRLGVYLPAVSAAVAREWVRRNPVVRVVPWRPRPRRYSSSAYRRAAGLFAVAAAAVWWFSLSDGEFGWITPLAFGVLVGAAVVSAFKALPVGFIRFDNARDPR
ncbi:hypothetical protein DMB66_35605 [Actinoplanes sp. ATCC 53533]|uniref:hypothetical protein n=1 Tax=Actinoplanes sp. ATCC 53533 TaxID=1288362 RepID=UPI000F770141|nr:hypothetical protein [Actinoplanes sp. ATCC 53533]RSM55638.1 hypothetical protein DMB66_35605 [Actinoplanes sp. ATCC 53533]